MKIETVKCDSIPLPISRIGLGTWEIGGRMWGGSAVEEAFGWKLSRDDYAEVDRILRETIKNPVGPEFMAPPAREPVAV